MKTPFQVIMLGTPGCGKSEIYRRIREKLIKHKIATEVIRIDDFPKLHACFVADDKAEAAGKPRKFSRKTKDGGWLVTNPAVWDQLLKMVQKDVEKERKKGKVVFIEFARPDMVRSISKCFSPAVRKSTVLLYVYCPFDICWERNVRRHKAAIAAGGDDHLVSREEMESTYATDDHHLLHKLKMPYVVVDNHFDGTDFLDFEIEKVLKVLKK